MIWMALHCTTEGTTICFVRKFYKIALWSLTSFYELNSENSTKPLHCSNAIPPETHLQFKWYVHQHPIMPFISVSELNQNRLWGRPLEVQGSSYKAIARPFILFLSCLGSNALVTRLVWLRVRQALVVHIPQRTPLITFPFPSTHKCL